MFLWLGVLPLLDSLLMQSCTSRPALLRSHAAPLPLPPNVSVMREVITAMTNAQVLEISAVVIFVVMLKKKES